MSAAHGNDGATAGGAPANGKPFAATIRSRPDVVRLGAPDAPVVNLRVQLAEAWDSLRFEVPASEPVLSLKVRALALLAPGADFHEDYVLKLRGFEVLDENLSVADTGARDGSVYLLTHRRRRPVR